MPEFIQAAQKRFTMFMDQLLQTTIGRTFALQTEDDVSFVFLQNIQFLGKEHQNCKTNGWSEKTRTRAGKVQRGDQDCLRWWQRRGQKRGQDRTPQELESIQRGSKKAFQNSPGCWKVKTKGRNYHFERQTWRKRPSKENQRIRGIKLSVG